MMRRLFAITTAAAALATAFVVRSAPATAAPSVVSSFDTGVGSLVAIGFDPATGNLFVYPEHGADIMEFTPAGQEVTPRIPRPAAGTSNDFDLDFALEGLNVGGTAVPANSLLAINGDEEPDRLYALDKNSGSVLASVALPSLNPVGGAHHPGRDSYFVVDYAADELEELDANSGAVINSFPVTPAGAGAFDVFYGDVDVSEATGNVFVVSNYQTAKQQTIIRELTPTGTFVLDHNLTSLGINEMAGIALDGAGDAWLATRNGVVYKVTGLSDVPSECTTDPNAVCGDASDDDFEGTAEDDFMFGGGGNDSIAGGGGNDTVLGGEGNDDLSGGTGDDDLEGGAGRDLLVGDVVSTGRSMQAEGGDDDLNGGSGNDELLGQAGSDALAGAGGDDVLRGGRGVNTFSGGPGTDTCVLSTRQDRTTSCEKVRKKYRRNF